MSIWVPRTMYGIAHGKGLGSWPMLIRDPGPKFVNGIKLYDSLKDAKAVRATRSVGAYIIEVEVKTVRRILKGDDDG